MGGGAQSTPSSSSNPVFVSNDPGAATPAPAFPTTAPGAAADAASLAAAQARLATVILPPGAISSATRPAGVASALALSFWCRPMADAIGYWTVPGMSDSAAVDYLKTHTPKGLTLEEVTSSNAAGDTSVDAAVIEYSATKDAQNGLVYEVTTAGAGAGIRADALVVPSRTTCATAPPGATLAAWGG